MATVQYTCAFCQRSESVSADQYRADQILYGAAWQHVMASHRDEANALMKTGIRERKESLLSWETKTQATG